jgi:hypothetical protein
MGLPGPRDHLVVQPLRLLQALEVQRVGLADEVVDAVAGLLEVADLQADAGQHRERGARRLGGERLARDPHHLVRDHRGLVEPAGDDRERLQPVEDLHALHARADAIAEGERAVEHRAELGGRPAERHAVAGREQQLQLELGAVAARARGQLAEQGEARAGRARPLRRARRRPAPRRPRARSEGSPRSARPALSKWAAIRALTMPTSCPWSSASASASLRCSRRRCGALVSPYATSRSRSCVKS